MPNDTDLTVFRHHGGVTGANLAFSRWRHPLPHRSRHGPRARPADPASAGRQRLRPGARLRRPLLLAFGRRQRRHLVRPPPSRHVARRGRGDLGSRRAHRAPRAGRSRARQAVALGDRAGSLRAPARPAAGRWVGHGAPRRRAQRSGFRRRPSWTIRATCSWRWRGVGVTTLALCGALSRYVRDAGTEVASQVAWLLLAAAGAAAAYFVPGTAYLLLLPAADREPGARRAAPQLPPGGRRGRPGARAPRDLVVAAPVRRARPRSGGRAGGAARALAVAVSRRSSPVWPVP